MDNPSLTQNDSAVFTVPAIAFNQVVVQPALIYASPNTTATLDIALTNVGNISGEFPLAVTLPISTWAPLSSYSSPVSLVAGESFTQPFTFSIADAELGRTYPVRVDSPAPGTAYTQTAYANVKIVSANVLDIYKAAQTAAQLFPEDISLQAALQYLGQATEELEATCSNDTVLAGPGQAGCATDLRDHVVSGALAVVNHAGPHSPLITADESMQQTAQDMRGHTAWSQIEGDLAILRGQVIDLQAQLQDIAQHGARVWFTPGVRVVLDGKPAAFDLNVTNQGSLTTTYAITLTASAPITPVSFVQALAAGATISLPVSITPPELGVYPLEAQVAAVEATHVSSLRAQASVIAVDALLRLTRVRAYPAFVEYSSGVAPAVSAQIANVANIPVSGNARVQTFDAAGTQVYSDTRVVQVGSALAPIDYPLGTINTTGFLTGTYTVTVNILDQDGQLIPKVSGQGVLAVGQAVQAWSGVAPSLVAPGDVTVTTFITTQGQ